MTTIETPEQNVSNPVEQLLRSDRIPTIWCPGCGIGTTVNSMAFALLKSGLDMSKVVVVSGIGCSGRVSGYMDTDSFHTTHGRAIPFATGLKLANPELTVIVYSGDGDLTSIGGNHLIHAARRNVDIKVICNNNMIYAMTGGQAAATTPYASSSTTTPFGSFEPELCIPQLVDAAGACYVARWTAYHVKQLESAIGEMIKKKGFSFVEVLSPCPTLYLRRNHLGDGRDAMLEYKRRSKIRHGAPTNEVAITADGPIICGKFVDRDRPDYLTLMHQKLGANFVAPLCESNKEEGGCAAC
jgi:2-oxoglutarate ferredoxin oxidoreductase subunit beta